MDIQVGNRTVEITSADKVLFPRAGITKGRFARYYADIADIMMPHVENRVVSMHRYPDGIDGGDFYHKQVPDYFPDWVGRQEVETKDGGRQVQVLLTGAPTLLYLAQQGCITPHVWLSRADHLDRPDFVVWDLDPGEQGWQVLRDTARWLRDLLEQLGLKPYLQVTGSAGIHVVSPIRPQFGFDRVRRFAQALADLLAARHPDTLTTAQRKNKRRGRLFLDVMRNAYGQTAVPPYAVRGREGATVATPIDWDELGKSDMNPRRYTIENILQRLAHKDDPWADLWRHKRSLEGPEEKLKSMQEDE
jgi:bifunctional non-homologous end joining protein LigD